MVRPTRCLWLAWLSALLLLSLVTRSAPMRASIQAPALPPAKDVATADEVQARCGTACHPLPPPDILPRVAWREELVRMMLIQDGLPEPAGASSFIPLPPEWLRLLRYFEARAPARLPDPDPWPDVDPGGLKLARRALPALDPEVATAIANARFMDLDEDGKLDIVASDMRSGSILAALAKDSLALKPIARLRHPAHIEQVDLDQDGLKDLLVADLGSFRPADHRDGSVVWLRRQKDGSFTPAVLAEGLARLADARPADFDDDGDLDIVLAVFGWRKTGNITILENRTKSWSSPSFVATVVDRRVGAIHVPTTDIDKDGKRDFVGLLAQEHESVVAFVNAGRGLTFTPQTVYAAPHPNWGSSGIELVDLDVDGDQDVLLTHGDTFDDFVVKPYHGIQWLENKGTFPFTEHRLASMPGAQRAQAADLDGDGDLDIVATAMIAGGELNPRLASLVWLEQVKPGTFERRTIEKGSPYHATLDLADFNGDGRTDILVGWFAFAKPLETWLDLWLNLGR
jgi:hypothetical protein